LNVTIACLLRPQIVLAALLVASASLVHFRGRVRLRFARQLTDHSTFTAPFNTLVHLFSETPNRPWLDPARFPQLAPLAANWTTIRDEGLALMDEGYVRAAIANNDIGFHTFFKRGWKRFYLKWYGEAPASATTLCPRTTELLAAIPSVHGAMFATLPPGGRLGRHRDPFAGSLRYHLGLRTANSDACWIEVDGERRSWRDGEALLFDETYVHEALNETDVDRLILFCDVERPVWGPVGWLNRFAIAHVMRATSTQNVEGEAVGALNRLYARLYWIKDVGQALKARNRRLYYAVKYLALGAVAALLLV
jgi:beta-hydroxylase